MSLYQKPKDVTMIDMCIYIDNNVYTENHDEQKIFEYLYHIIKMKARDKRYFHSLQYYDDFAIFGATQVYMRLINPRQYKYKEDGEPELKKIKSVLNYINTILYPLKVDFEQSEYYQTVFNNDDNDFTTYNFDNLFLTSQGYVPEKIEYKLVLQDIYSICDEELQKLKHLYKQPEWLNICISVKLSLLKQLNLTRSQIDYLKHLMSTNNLRDSHVIKCFKDRQNVVQLFHLPKEQSNYVLLLTRIIKRKIGIYLSDVLHTNYVDPNIIDVLVTEFKESIEGKEENEFNE